MSQRHERAPAAGHTHAPGKAAESCGVAPEYCHGIHGGRIARCAHGCTAASVSPPILDPWAGGGGSWDGMSSGANLVRQQAAPGPAPALGLALVPTQFRLYWEAALLSPKDGPAHGAAATSRTPQLAASAPGHRDPALWSHAQPSLLIAPTPRSPAFKTLLWAGGGPHSIHAHHASFLKAMTAVDSWPAFAGSGATQGDVTRCTANSVASPPIPAALTRTPSVPTRTHAYNNR